MALREPANGGVESSLLMILSCHNSMGLVDDVADELIASEAQFQQAKNISAVIPQMW